MLKINKKILKYNRIWYCVLSKREAEIEKERIIKKLLKYGCTIKSSEIKYVAWGQDENIPPGEKYAIDIKYNYD